MRISDWSSDVCSSDLDAGRGWRIVMFIQTEETPNPATLKFLPGRQVMASGTAEFKAEEEAARSPLAQALFQVDGVTGVFLGYDFISVSKRDGKEWYLMKPGVLGVIERKSVG